MDKETGTILSYLTWRGDLEFTERAFCDVDNLVLSEFAYLDFSGIVPTVKDDTAITIADAGQAYFKNSEYNASNKMHVLLRKMAESKRFQKLRLTNYQDILDKETMIQFGAIQIELNENRYYLAFRGTTDDIEGWREDFSLSYQVMSAQKAALNYVNEVMKEDSEYLLGGHSKGGNLAVYSAMMCEGNKQEQMKKIYSNDGPGFCRDVIDIEKYNVIREKVIHIVPSFCVIGMLFEIDTKKVVVGSNHEGIVQHDGFSWQVEGDDFVRCDSLEKGSLFYHELFDKWMESADMNDRSAFVKDFFDALESGGAVTIDEIANARKGGFENILLSLVHAETDTKETIGKLVLATQSITMIGYIVIVLLIGKKLLDCAVDEPNEKMKKWKLCLYMMGIALVSYLSAYQKVRILSANLILSALFLYTAVSLFKQAGKLRNTKWKEWGLLILGFISIAVGICAFVTHGQIAAPYMVAVGSIIIVYSVVCIVGAIYEQTDELKKR